MNRYKNNHYKSAVQFYNTTEQEILATNTVTNPITLTTGVVVTDTGCALDINSFNVDVEASGLYRVHADFDVLGVTGGDITFAIAYDGQILPETVSTITAVAAISEKVSMETVRVVSTCCIANEHRFSIVAYSDGTGVATVQKLSGNVIKLA